MRDVYLTIPQATWDAIDAQATPPGCVPYRRDYHTASIMFEGQTLDGVGIHVKGGCGSARHMNGKASFKKTADNAYASTSSWTSSKNGGATTSQEACTRQ